MVFLLSASLCQSSGKHETGRQPAVTISAEWSDVPENKACQMKKVRKKTQYAFDIQLKGMSGQRVCPGLTVGNQVLSETGRHLKFF